MNVAIFSERLMIIEAHPEHIDELTKVVFGDPDVMKFSDDGILDRNAVTEWVTNARESYRKNGYGPWIVIEKNSNSIIGYCGLFLKEINLKPEVEMGYRIAKKFQGKGYGTEAGSAVISYAKSKLNIPRIVALIDPNNSASIRVAEKLQFKKESEVMMPGYDHPDMLYSYLK